MNQILLTKFKNVKYKNFFRLQLLISLIIVFTSTIQLSQNNRENKDMEYLSRIINKNLKVSSIYNVEKHEIEKNIYLGTIKIPKIELEYTVYNELTDDLLRVAPCKFYGVDLGEKGNLCIVGHNYNNNRFFSRLDELEFKDKIIIVDLENREYVYTVFDMYEVDENDFSCLENSKEYELTLLTCNNSNKKRRIIKALKE